MGSASVTTGVDTWVGSLKPTLEHADAEYLNLRSGQSEVYFKLPCPAPRGASILSATLTAHAKGPSSGVRTLALTPIAGKWKVKRAVWGKRPPVAGATVNTVVDALADGDPIVWSGPALVAYLQAVASGQGHYGWRITSTAATKHQVYGFDSGSPAFRLDVEWADEPDAPTSLTPSEAAVGVAKWVCQFDYTDLSGSVELAAVQVQVDPAADEVSPDFDTGEVAAVVPELDLAATGYPGLASGASTAWRCRVKDAAGLWSEWSDWVTVTRVPQGALAITSSSSVYDITPETTWALTGATQQAWQVLVTDVDDPTHVLYDSFQQTGADTGHTIPPGVLGFDESYRRVVRTWDTADRETTPGDPAYVEASQVFTVSTSSAVTQPSAFTATVLPEKPGALLSWTRAAEAGLSFVLTCDGVPIAWDLDPDDTRTSGNRHEYTDHGMAAGVAHTYAVHAVVGDVASHGTTATTEAHPPGIWLVDPARDLYVQLGGKGVDEWRELEVAAVYNSVGSDRPVKITTGRQGLTGPFKGVLRDRSAEGGLSVEVMEDAVRRMQEHPTRVLKLVFGKRSIPVVVLGLSLSPHPDSTSADPRHWVTLERFWQHGQYPYKVVL
jgi:hypothetical protein